MIALACGGESSGFPSAAFDPGAGGQGSSTVTSSSSVGGSYTGSGAASSSTGRDWTPVETTWCSEGWLGLDEKTCLFLPADAPASRLVIYLHGMMPEDASSEGQQKLLASSAKELGLAVLFPQGRQGLCSWSSSVEDWLCWPTSRANVDAHTDSFSDEWKPHLALSEQLNGKPFERRYAMGFSNGGYFASFLALEGLWAMDGAALSAAGRSFIDEANLAGIKPPIFIAVGAQDTDTTVASAQTLAKVLKTQGWPHRLVIDPERGHELRHNDLLRAAELWEKE